MRPDFVDKLLCPARGCESANLVLQADDIQTIRYKNAELEEVKQGQISCQACGRVYPIDDFVLSFDQLFPVGLLREADYWGKWYSFMWTMGYYGFFDLRAKMAPLIYQGIEALDPARLDRKDLGGSHSILASHPSIRGATDLLDVGCGTGWSSLYLARQGHNVVAFDPSTINMKLAKRYAISEGECIEYVGAAVGYLAFKPEVFDAVIALHSLHHVPDLEHELSVIRQWLREGGAIGIDEHVGDDPVLQAIRVKMQEWAIHEVYPKARTLDLDVLRASLPTAPHSELEGVGSKDVITATSEHFEVEFYAGRHISLDTFSFLYFIAKEQDPQAYMHASQVIDRLYRLYAQAFPQTVEAAMLVARKGAVVGRAQQEVPSASRVTVTGDSQIEALQAAVKSLQGRVVELQGTIAVKNAHIAELSAWARSMERALQRREEAQAPSLLSRARRRFRGARRKR
jgi:SAM-dependent methyltransferase